MTAMAANGQAGLRLTVKDRDVISFDDLIGTRLITLDDIRR